MVFLQGQLPGGPLLPGQSMILLEEDTKVGLPNAAVLLEKALSEAPPNWDVTLLYGGLKACRDASPGPQYALTAA